MTHCNFTYTYYAYWMISMMISNLKLLHHMLHQCIQSINVHSMPASKVIKLRYDAFTLEFALELAFKFLFDACALFWMTCSCCIMSGVQVDSLFEASFALSCMEKGCEWDEALGETNDAVDLFLYFRRKHYHGEDDHWSFGRSIGDSSIPSQQFI